MKKQILLLFIVIFAITGCGSDKGSNSESNNNPETTTSSDTDSEKGTEEFTLEELSKYNGQDGQPAYVAVDGIVYDVTDVSAWKNGKHKKGLEAGNDLTEDIGSSPHGKNVLKKLPVVGTLVE